MLGGLFTENQVRLVHTGNNNTYVYVGRLLKELKKLKALILNNSRIQTNFQFRHLSYLSMPKSIEAILHRRVHFVSLISFLLYIICESLFTTDVFTFIDTLLG